MTTNWQGHQVFAGAVRRTHCYDRSSCAQLGLAAQVREARQAAHLSTPAGGVQLLSTPITALLRQVCVHRCRCLYLRTRPKCGFHNSFIMDCCISSSQLATRSRL